MDCGTGFTKLGFAGGAEPSFVIPTALGPGTAAAAAAAGAGSTLGYRGGSGALLGDLDFTIGEKALAAAHAAGGAGGGAGGGLVFPVRHGVVADWDAMERFCYLRVDPEEHCVVVTEPPLNPPESREALAEIMFETFNVAGLYVGVQAVLALYAGWAIAGRADRDAAKHLTGTVVDVGEGVAHIIPVVDGFVLEGAIKCLPLAGRAVTSFVQQMLRERGEPVPPEMSLELCRRIKEGHCYVAPDMLREFGRYDKDPGKYHRTLKLHNPRAGADFTVELGYERFLAPEVFFSPGICSSAPQGTPSLPRAVDDVIQACPIDTRRALYGNVVLSGGSTMFKNFGRRLAADLTAATSRRLQPGATAPPRVATLVAIDINVRSHAMQRYAVWFGGSLVACDPGFGAVCHTREQYQEHGPSICRTNYVFRDV
ncbi:actin-related protein Arp3 [Volvox carteri f. nagariensis]|uniref:Actin-related protein Arp3 n=1 Tax=Volvox carteri f. nagariensis TaxID=3068 RepID=D8TSU8_VOLCA|nr:actin-related protein Arp3 [Volvox carteri f. nagariensis]EFJ49440.1 actin-related protein Arp3 [Volvox carteri f. nagariensis]|eukprot:XP_002949421.1 actin-related protein Arp3 [Volvox carteri f. nagariensis]